MSACISTHGEYGEHELDDRFRCTLCREVDVERLLTALDEARERAATWDEVDRLSHENLLKERDNLRAQVERLHFDLDREARARQAAEGALTAVRADLRTLAFDMHRGWKHVASGADAAVLIDKFLDSHATPTTTEEPS